MLCIGNDNDIINISTEILALNSSEFIAIADDNPTIDIEYDSSYDDIDDIVVSNAADRVDVIVKFYTACSRNMSGNSGRIVPDTMLIKNVSIKGFNGSVSTPSAIGRNEDNKMEYFVQSMMFSVIMCSRLCNRWCSNSVS